MTLKEKLAEPFGGLRTETLDELLIIVDGYAEDFGRWLRENEEEDLLISELLEIFIKEKGL